MEYETLTLPIDKMHILRKAPEGWEYLVQENVNFRKAYYLYPNEVDYKTYNFEGFESSVTEVSGGIVVTFHSGDARVSCTYNMNGKLVREDTLSMIQIYENLRRCQSDYSTQLLHKKKQTATPMNKLQSVSLPIDDVHSLSQTPTGLWRYKSELSKRIYVLYLSELDIKQNKVIITLYDRKVRVYVDKQPLAYEASDVVTYMITREKEYYFDDKVEFPVNASLIVNRRGWGNYIHFFDKDMQLHAFKLYDDDKVPESIPHILDVDHIGDTTDFVGLYGDSYEDIIVTPKGEYIPQNIFYSAIRLAKPKMNSPFYNQAGLIRQYKSNKQRLGKGN